VPLREHRDEADRRILPNKPSFREPVSKTDMIVSGGAHQANSSETRIAGGQVLSLIRLLGTFAADMIRHIRLGYNCGVNVEVAKYPMGKSGALEGRKWLFETKSTLTRS
jgi:hypothetical protein